MQTRVLLVVGEKFAGFAAGQDVIGIAHLRLLLTLPNGLVMGNERLTLLPGQGLADSEVEAVLALAAQSPQSERFDFSAWRTRPQRADSRLTHKHDPANILVSMPRQLTADEYELALLIDETCELLSDHQTGQHLSGVLLFEAARQATLAVTEAFYLPQDGLRHEFVMSRTACGYSHFCFPLATRIRYQVLEYKQTANRQRFCSRIVFEQCDTEIASFLAHFTAFSRPRLGSRESAAAVSALAQHVEAGARLVATESYQPAFA